MKPFLPSFAALLFTFATPIIAQPIVSESFESGDLSASHSSGFNWSGTNKTSLVKRDANAGDTIIYAHNRATEEVVGFDREWQAIDGDVSMRFNYPAGEYQSEQRFSLEDAHTDLWIRFWLKVPINFKHSSNSPTNNKLFALWMDGYSSKGDGPTAFWTFWHDGSGGSTLAYHYARGGYTVANAAKEQTSFIRYPEDQGRWMQIVMRVKAASSSSANDGIMQFYRRWADESSFTLFHDHRSADIAPPSGGPFGWKAGYFMGWSNPGYAQDTEWLLDDLVISRSSLLEEVSPVEPPEKEPDSDDSCRPVEVPTIFAR